MTSNEQFRSLRKEYYGDELSEKSVDKNPLEQFRKWFNDAIQYGVDEPNAMALSTSNAFGKPSSRMVLLKGFDERGFWFFTGLSSRKSQEMNQNPHACLLFYWQEYPRQIRIEGSVNKLDADESENYFRERPRGSQIAAWTSEQSKPLSSRKDLLKKHEEFTSKFSNKEVIPCPPEWVGYLIVPDYFEFWQGRENRLHDRIVYEKSGDEWEIKRLFP